MKILYIQCSVSTLDDSRRNSLNPLSQGIPLKSQYIFVDVICFALEENKELLYAILKHTTTGNSEYDSSTVIQTAYIYMMFASKINSNCNAFKKLLAVFLQASGLTLTGLEALNKLGVSESQRMLHETKIQLAVYDETNIKEVAKHNLMVCVIDNMDRQVKQVLQHQTLPILLCRNINDDISGLNAERQDINAVIKSSFTSDFLLLDNPRNQK